MNKSQPIAVYEVDSDKKDSVTRYTMEKMLKEIKASMLKHGKVKIIIEKA